jgi:DnaD/phage-associated family protein
MEEYPQYKDDIIKLFSNSSQTIPKQLDEQNLHSTPIANTKAIAIANTIVPLANSSQTVPATKANNYELYQKNIGQLSSIIADKIKDAETEYTPEWVCDAITKAVSSEKRNWSYVNGILEGWKREGRGNNGHNNKPIESTIKYKPLDTKSPEYLSYIASLKKDKN